MYDASDFVIAYHYTTLGAWKSMISGETYGRKSLVGSRRFIPLDRHSAHLPEKALDGVVCALHSPRPDDWICNPEFPEYWDLMLDDISRDKDMVLLSFPLYGSDDAYVVDKAPRVRALYRSLNGDISDKEMLNANSKVWDSRVHVHDYKGGYDLPQISIWNDIELDRLRLEAIMDKDEPRSHRRT